MDPKRAWTLMPLLLALGLAGCTELGVGVDPGLIDFGVVPVGTTDHDAVLLVNRGPDRIVDVNLQPADGPFGSPSLGQLVLPQDVAVAVAVDVLGDEVGSHEALLTIDWGGDSLHVVLLVELVDGAVDADRDGIPLPDDCDDLDPLIHPDAEELCDGIDNDCDGLPEPDEVDADGDGSMVCDGDCDDDEPAAWPGAEEVCDGIDNDCDGLLGEDDLDGDGWRGCDGDCDDDDAAIHPEAVELCNGIDDDCDGVIGEDDADGDGYRGCEGDCDDDEPAVFPGADEVCNGIDDDCDGLVDLLDDDLLDAELWHPDSDGDGYGNAAFVTAACEQPEGFVSDATDCDDTLATVHPGAAELCNGLDDDCDSTTLEDDGPEADTWYADGDADGFGDPSIFATACDQPVGTVLDATDCDDADPSVHPGAAELCNGLDDDCDPATDEDDGPDADTWYVDADGDGYGDPSVSVTDCDPIAGAVLDGGDCNDAQAAIHPGATELCDGLDNDCDPTTLEDDGPEADTWYIDGDGDGYGDPASETTSCSQPADAVEDATDCDDAEAAIHPNAVEICDGLDNDCDPATLEDEGPEADTWYDDADSDGYGDPATGVTACTQPGGSVADFTDCEDDDGAINPGATEACNGIDEDCDGVADDGGVCPCNVEDYGGHVYLFCESVQNWWDSLAACRAQTNFDLVTIDDGAEQGWVHGMAAGYNSGRWWWIGYNDTGSEGNFQWADGSSSTYTNWGGGQPDDYWGEDCVHMYGDSGAWNDLECDDDGWYGTDVNFICESTAD
jgi:hypothetical protein